VPCSGVGLPPYAGYSAGFVTIQAKTGNFKFLSGRGDPMYICFRTSCQVALIQSTQCCMCRRSFPASAWGHHMCSCSASVEPSSHLPCRVHPVHKHTGPPAAAAIFSQTQALLAFFVLRYPPLMWSWNLLSPVSPEREFIHQCNGPTLF
jgi:hypothetical protein